ncbi:MAG: SDR family oxidoreductase, partial [Candidatus Omnitrophica bacterium]|nr:SDR family oxidoreductase [Candidatus Omnitrophota bacterium]
GAGFIGSHIVEVLVKKGHCVRVLDDFSSGKEENLSAVINRIEIIKGDIRNREICFRAARGIDFILHQAALRSVPKSLDNPEEYNAVNIQGTLNMLEAARDNKVKGFVFASSSAVYGEAKRFPQREDDLPQLISPYALTKLAGEYYCRIFAKNYGLNTISLRYFNVFGPRQALDDEYAVVIPKFINCLLRGESPPIYGTGRQSRDFTYVENVVKANLCALDKVGFKGEVFNVAQGENHSVLELLRILKKILKKRIKPTFLPPRPADVFKTHADINRSRRFLGFRPEVSFYEGLRLTVDWFRQK